jgi:hypothetical protein
MSKIEVNAIEPQSGTTLTLGASGDTITIPAGATISNSGTAAGFGPTGAVSWNTTKITANPNPAVTGVGYFCDTTTAAFTVTLPATPAAGAVVGIADYANTFATNNLTIGRNGSNIAGAAINATLSTNGVSVTFVYVDATQGWIVTDSGNRSDLPQATYISATGGTVLTCGNYKTHVFTGPGTFTVSSLGNPAGGGSNVDYLVVAGGGSGAQGYAGGGGGAGGFRMSNSGSLPAPTTSPLANPTGLTLSVSSYPITVGSGGASSPGVGLVGSSSIFSTITSAGGGGGSTAVGAGGSGGSGGGGGTSGGGPTLGGAGNTPPTSPSQGNNGGNSATQPFPNAETGGGGGGGGAVGGNGTPGGPTGTGGNGSFIDNNFIGPTSPSYGTPGPVGSTRYFAGGGSGGGVAPIPAPSIPNGGFGGGGKGSAGTGNPNAVAGTINTGGGGGGGGAPGSCAQGGAGGSGIVLIRYRFQ